MAAARLTSMQPSVPISECIQSWGRWRDRETSGKSLTSSSANEARGKNWRCLLPICGAWRQVCAASALPARGEAAALTTVTCRLSSDVPLWSCRRSRRDGPRIARPGAVETPRRRWVHGYLPRLWPGAGLGGALRLPVMRMLDPDRVGVERMSGHPKTLSPPGRSFASAQD